MSKNPFINAFAAVFYIGVVACIMFYGKALGEHPDTIIVPIAMISLFTLSAAMMGYLFLFEPLQLYLDGSKKQAAALFLQTLGVFAVITLLAFVLMLSGII